MLFLVIGLLGMVWAASSVVKQWRERRRQQAQEQRQREEDARRTRRTGQPQPPRRRQAPAEMHFESEICPICLVQPPNSPCMTNCGHVFCADCFVQFHGSNRRSVLPCPMCRHNIRVILLIDGVDYTDEQRDVFQSINVDAASHPPSLLQRVMDTPALLRLLWAHISSGRALSFLLQMRTLVVMLSGIAYTLLPIDLVPEIALGVLGLVDDGVIAGICLVQVAMHFREYVLQQQATAQQQRHRQR